MNFNMINKSLLSLAIVALSFSTSCSSHESEERHGHEHSEAVEENPHEHHSSEIVMTPEDATRFGVAVEAVDKSLFNEVVKVAGEILPAATDRILISAPTSGFLKFVSGVESGKQVAVGELIATVSSTDVSGGNADKAAKATLDAATKELERLSSLLKDGLITQKEYNDAVMTYEVAKSSYSSHAESGRVISPMSGVITGLSVSDGSYVEIGQPITIVGCSRKLTLRALLPAKYIDLLPRIYTANIRPSHSTGEAISLIERGGRILSSSVAAGDNIPGYIPVYFSFDSRGDIIPGSPAEVYLIGLTKTETIAVPIESISEQQGEKFVYIKEGDHAYVKTPVKAGLDDGRRVEIISGLSVGDSVVSAGTTFIRLAETSTIVPEGHSHSH